MPRSPRSFQLTETYRARLLATRERTLSLAEKAWRGISLEDFENTYTAWLDATVSAVAQAQRQGVRLSHAYLTAFVSSELGRRIRTPLVDASPFVGVSRDGRTLSEAYDSPRVGILAALKAGVPNEEALKVGLERATRFVGVDTDHAARAALLEAIDADERIEGWQRAVRGTCGACAGLATGPEQGTQFEVHPNCACVAEPIVRSVPQTVVRATGAAIFAAKDKAGQDEMLGPEAAEKVRAGEAELQDFVGRSRLATDQADYVTQKPASEIS